MPVTRADVEHMARLARLRLDEDEAERMTAQLGSILDHMEALARADVSGVQGAGGTMDGPSPRGRDPGERPDPLQRPPATWAPDWRDGFFVVPRLPAVEGGSDEEEASGDPSHP